jgi:hypothetical protein
MKTMNPKIGETWLDRSGSRIAIINIYEGEKPVVGMNDKKVLVAYTKEGLINGPKFPHPYDLISKTN